MLTSLLRSARITLEMIKIEHTVFALPFALLGALLAAEGLPSAHVLFWILMAMVSARSAAMAMNRLVDREYDAMNPRTMSRALPSGLVTIGFVRAFIIVSSGIFFLSAARLNWLTLALSPIALASILFYSYAKRVTAYTHLILGWCLAIAPTGGWIAVRGTIDSPIPLWLSFGVMTWTAGFDILYSCQDVEFDNRVGLQSLPQRYGVSRALWIARVLHTCTFTSLVIVAILADMRIPAGVGLIVAGAMLLRQHLLVRSGDLSKLNQAFFNTNAFLSLVLLLSMGADILITS